jgi:RNA polymerase sigma-70 factor (ECF subfamily)
VNTTSLTLLELLRTSADAAAWKCLVGLYTPFIHGWLGRQAVPPEDADDLVQEVLTVLFRELPQFQHNQRQGAFRCWLRTVTVHRLRAYWKARRSRPEPLPIAEIEQLAELEAPGSLLSQLWDREHDRHVLRRLLELIEPEFSPAAWQAFRWLTFDGRRPAEVAGELGMTVNAVLLAKSRILRRLRQEAEGLID